jgi:hypothetical protein
LKTESLAEMEKLDIEILNYVDQGGGGVLGLIHG